MTNWRSCKISSLQQSYIEFNSALVCCSVGVVISLWVENQSKTKQELQLLFFFDNFALFAYQVVVFCWWF